jgi:hypothetical protein
VSLARGPAGTAAERKATLVAASARLRSELRAQLSPAAVRDTQAARLLSSAGALLRQPVVVGAIAVTLLAIGPRRVYRLVRWTALTLPLHPLGRRLIPALGARLLSALTADTPARSR